MFDVTIYEKSIVLADSLINRYKNFDLFCSKDLVHEAFIVVHEKKEEFTVQNLTKHIRFALEAELRYNEQIKKIKGVKLDPLQICTKCGDTKPASSFTVLKGIYFNGYCNECRNKMNKKQAKSEYRRTGVKKTCIITVYDQYGKIFLKASSMLELEIKWGHNHKQIKNILAGRPHRTIHLYDSNVKFIKNGVKLERNHYYIKKEDL